MVLTQRQQTILDIVAAQTSPLSISGIRVHLPTDISIPTLNRDLAALVRANCLLKTGQGRGVAYKLSPSYRIFAPIPPGSYFERDPDARKALTGFNHDLIHILAGISLFTPAEQTKLESLRQEYQANIAGYPESLHRKETERLTIELSWKSSQIEGNTYSLLETERLFLEKQEAEGKPHDDAIMLLNHKEALQYILAHEDIGRIFNLTLLEDIHSLLIKDLGVSRNIRTRTVGITGTAYRPIDNEYQIREATEEMCALINTKQNGFEKALLAVALISYIQPFEDGNKRAARLAGNTLLMAYGACPLSYRSVDSLDYKKAMLLLYEQNNLAFFKEIFIDQVAFSVKNYFT